MSSYLGVLLALAMSYMTQLKVRWQGIWRKKRSFKVSRFQNFKVSARLRAFGFETLKP
jgi:hypothetical protein